MKDYYNILGVGENASDNDIKKAYRTLAMKHHPDRGGDQAKFQEIQEAYDTLTNPQKKAEWENQRRGGFHHFGGHPGGHPGGGFHFNFGGPGGFDINDIFRSFNAGGDPFANFRQAQFRNRDLRVAVDLDLVETLSPQTKHISIQHLNGTRKTVSVDVPRGINGAMQMKYAGHGDHSRTDLPPGDLYIDFRVRAHPDFQVDGLDLVRLVKLNCLEAVAGTTVNVKGLDDTEFVWNVPVGSQNGTKFRIPNQGLWALDHPVRGNLFLVLELTVPTNLTTDQLLRIESVIKELERK